MILTSPLDLSFIIDDGRFELFKFGKSNMKSTFDKISFETSLKCKGEVFPETFAEVEVSGVFNLLKK